MAISLHMPNRDTVPGLSAALLAARKRAGLTQVQVEELTGIYQINISRFENDKATPTIRLLYKLAEAYDVDVCDLLPRKRKR